MKAFFAALSPTTWLIALALAGALTGYHFYSINSARSQGYEQGLGAGRAEGERRLSAFRESFTKSMERELTFALQASTDLQHHFQATEKTKNENLARLTTRVADLSGRLRERPSRDDRPGRGYMPDYRPAPGAAAGGDESVLRGSDRDLSGRATGADLAREDAQYLLSEAARADELRLAYEKLASDYDAVKVKLDEIQQRTLDKRREVERLQ